MSARSKDMIGAALISAGIPMAGEIHLAAGPSTLAFASYWKDWFENDRYHDSTNGIAVGYAALVEGRGDVLLVAPRTDHVISTNLVWSKDNTHLVGAGQLYTNRPNVILRPGQSSVTILVTADATGCIFSGLTMRNAAVTASTACIHTFKTSTNAVGTIMRNCFLWGPEDDTINDATGGWRLIDLAGDCNYFSNCLVGYGWPIAGAPAAAVNQPCLIFFRKSVFNHSVFENCIFQGEFKETAQAIMLVEYSPPDGVFHIFRNCQGINIGSTSCEVAITSNVGTAFSGGGKNLIYFDGNCAFAGVTDISNANNESYIKFPPSHAWSTSDTPLNAGIAMSYDAAT